MKAPPGSCWLLLAWLLLALPGFLDPPGFSWLPSFLLASWLPSFLLSRLLSRSSRRGRSCAPLLTGTQGHKSFSWILLAHPGLDPPGSSRLLLDSPGSSWLPWLLLATPESCSPCSILPHLPLLIASVEHVRGYKRAITCCVRECRAQAVEAVEAFSLRSLEALSLQP